MSYMPALFGSKGGVKLQNLATPTMPKDASPFEMWSFPSEKEGFGCSGALAKMPGVPSGGMGTIVYFASDDCAIEEKRIVPAGGKVERRKMSIGEYGFITLAIDSEGNTFGLHSMK